MPEVKPKQFKILKCFDTSLWYHSYINRVFTVVRESDVYVWTREPDEYGLLNIVLKTDIEFINHPNKETN